MNNPIKKLYQIESELDDTHIDPDKRQKIKDSIKRTDNAYKNYEQYSLEKRFIDSLPIFDIGLSITKDRLQEMKMPGSGGYLDNEFVFTLFFYRKSGVKYGYFYIESETGNIYKFNNQMTLQIFMKLLENEYI